MMEKRVPETTVSATDAKNNFGALLGKVADQRETVIVERQGKERAAIISIEEYRQFRDLQEQQRRREAVEQLRQLQKEISAAFSDLSDDEIDAMVNEISKEAVGRVMERQGIRFE